MNSIEEVRARCVVDPVTRCWHWGGSKSKGRPSMYCIDLDRVVKTTMAGRRAVWYLAHNEKLNGRIVYSRCQCLDCVNPVHVGAAWSMAEVGAHIGRVGLLKGRNVEKLRENAAKALAARGIEPTAPEIVFALRKEPASVTTAELERRYGIPHQVISRIRRGVSHRWLLEATA